MKRHQRRVERAVIFLSSMLSIPASARGQELLRDWAGVQGTLSIDDQFGGCVAGIGDVDGDGVVDMLVSAPYEDPTQYIEIGAVSLISGATGTVLQHVFGTHNRDLFGWQVCTPGDLDGDGVTDFLVGAADSVFNTAPGKVYAYSGSTGASLFTLQGRAGDTFWGRVVRAVGDVDADGVGDFGVGANVTGPGDVWVYSGATQAVIYKFHGSWTYANLSAVCGVGDLDGDGHADFGIGALGDGPNAEGVFTVYSGATRKKIYSFQGEHNRSAFGSDACALGDTDGDGTADFAVDALAYSGTFGAEGRVYIYSGSTGNLLWEYTGTFYNEKLGQLPTNGKLDLNRDGYADIPIGSYQTSTLHVYSGRTGTLLYDFHNDGIAESMGPSSAIGDLNGDGIDDILVGAPDNARYYSGAGRAYVYAGNDLFLQANSRSLLANDFVSLEIRGGEPGHLSCFVLTDLSGTPMFLPIAIGALDGNGNYALTGTTPSGLAGTTMTCIGYAIGANGHTVIDSSPETLVFK